MMDKTINTSTSTFSSTITFPLCLWGMPSTTQTLPLAEGCGVRMERLLQILDEVEKVLEEDDEGFMCHGQQERQ
jgi:hypothetical protein